MYRTLLILALSFLALTTPGKTDEASAETDEEVESKDKVPYVTTANFEEEVLQSNIPVLVDFTATWCVPCKIVDPIIDSLLPEMSGRAKVVKLDIDDSPEIYSEYRVNGVPHILFFNNGQEEDRISSPQDRSIYVTYLESMIAGKSALEVTVTLLNQDDFRRHFILTREIEDVKYAMDRHPELLTANFENGQTPLSLILNFPSVRQNDLIELTLAEEPTINTYDLVGLGRCNEFKTALEEDPDAVNRSDPDGNPPLITAMRRAFRLEGKDCVLTLLDSGADLAIQDTENFSLGRTVILLNNDDLLKEFLARGWDPERQDASGKNALHWAALYGYLSNAKILVDHGVDVATLNSDGETAVDVVRRARDRRQASYEQQKDEIDPKYIEEIENGLADMDSLIAVLETPDHQD